MRSSSAHNALWLALTLAFPAACVVAQEASTVFEFAKAPGRLPKNVVPLEYTIALTPNTADLSVAGTESIVLEFKESTATIVFNSLNQKLSKVLLDGKPVQTVVSDDTAQLTTITLARPAAPGRHTLTFAYAGKIEKNPVGLFLQQYVTPSGTKDAMLTTQFEATDARRMFPCWDEPAFRAVFKLSVTVPAAWSVYSNMPENKRSVKGALATTSFAATPKMPSYLVEFSGGNLAHIGAESGGTRFRVVAVKGQEQGGQQALINAQQILADYNDYFGVRFPLPKLDSIAVPGGFSGAMENWGAITYNDQALLITPSSTMANRQGVYSIQAHEMAHQWFGDLVTMGWWDELWLNESFASWMAAKQTDLRNPSWHWWQRQDEQKEGAMSADSRATSHPILQHVTNELQATNAFDPAITYDKGQAVLRMLESYMGPDTFRQGIRTYMKTHAYSNTLSGNLWQALDGAGGKKASDIALSWTSQAGFPLVSVAASCDAAGKRTIALSQQRFLLQGLGSGKGKWQVPLQVRSGTGAPQPVLLGDDGQRVDAGRCDEALSVNAGAIGYFRASYDDATLALNTRLFGAMPDADRIALLDDQWALVGAGAQSLGSYLALASAMGVIPNERSWNQITEALATIETAERGTPGYAAFTAYARSVIKPLSLQMGWDAKADEAPGTRKLRRTLLADLGTWGDEQVIAEARKRFAGFIADRKTISADEQGMVLGIVAANATPAEFEQLHAIAKGSKNETELRRYYSVLMRVGDPALAERAGAIALSDEISQQADMVRINLVGALGEKHPLLAWGMLQKNVERLLAPHQPFAPMILAQYSPEMFWRAIPPDEMETWIKGQVPPDMAPQLARGMEVARYKLAQKQMLVKSADAYVSGIAGGKTGGKVAQRD